MKLEVYTDPTLLDFLKVVAHMAPAEIENFEAITGEKYNVDGIALGNFSVAGPKWVIKAGDVPICVGGFAPLRPGVWRDFMINTPDAWEKYGFGVSRICRRAVNAMFASGQAHRLECVSVVSASREVALRWYRILGYHAEATLSGYCANGADAIIYSRVQH